MADLVLVGASGLAREVQAAVRDIGLHRVVGVLDDDPDRHGSDLAGVPVLGDVMSARDHRDAQLVLCVGHGTDRRRIADRLAEVGVQPRRYATVVHPRAHLPATCSVGPGSIVLAGVVATTAVTIGQHAVVMPHVTLTHDVVVGNYATLAAGVSLGGGVVVGQEAYLGMNAAVRSRVRVGYRSTLGMGGMLLADLPPDEVWAGVPARRLGAGRKGQR
jgi:sugar O-acyltransferase (sialic acid O-acetyltransferase NeuD family)